MTPHKQVPGNYALGLSRRYYDVAVRGSGPAGAAVAIVLVRKGLSVVVLCRSRKGPAVGETVPPSIIRPLTRLGLWANFLAAGHAQAHGTVTAWGDALPFENDFVFNAYGPGWHIDRGAFDAMLLSGARKAGADIYSGRVLDCIPVDDPGWTLTLRDDGGSLHARWVVDATGRSGWLSRRRGAARRSVDRLVALVKFMSAESIRETRTLVEASESGWWYAAALPANRAVVAYFSDADLLPRDNCGRGELWNTVFARTEIIANCHQGLPGEAPLCFAASSQRLTPCAGARWIAVGDAVASYDPLSGQGITKALACAIYGAECISDRLADGAPPENFIATMSSDYDKYLQSRISYYAREGRWQNSVFWQRRNGPPEVRITPDRQNGA
jgi:flavin-dependent dehydrogenase